MDVPDVRYARAGGVAIAYQVVGDGPRTLVVSPHLSDLLTIWQVPSTAAFLRRLADELGVVAFNPRGTGISERPRTITLEARTDRASGAGRPDLARRARATPCGGAPRARTPSRAEVGPRGRRSGS